MRKHKEQRKCSHCYVFLFSADCECRRVLRKVTSQGELVIDSLLGTWRVAVPQAYNLLSKRPVSALSKPCPLFLQLGWHAFEVSVTTLKTAYKFNCCVIRSPPCFLSLPCNLFNSSLTLNAFKTVELLLSSAFEILPLMIVVSLAQINSYKNSPQVWSPICQHDLHIGGP